LNAGVVDQGRIALNEVGAQKADAKPAWWIRAIRRIGLIIVWGVIGFVVLWCALALYYSNLPASLRPWVAWLFVTASVGVLFFLKPRRRGFGVFLALVTAVLVYYWGYIPPSNDRHWRKDVSVLPWAEIDGNHVSVHNIRNSEYRTATDFDLHHYDRTFDVNQLRSMDFFMCFWAPMPFCHTMMSFGFENGDVLCVSIETRPEEHEGYSALASCFKQYELIYVAGDERDLVRSRTNLRDEAVYLYHIDTTPEAMRRVFLSYCRRMNDLKAHPEWYYILTRNCTTDIPRRDGQSRWTLPESWKVILNGFVDQYLYREGSLDQRMPLAELRKAGHINTRGENADKDPEFSRLIRAGIPELERATTVTKE
jgi:hypothetical protein